MVPTESAELRGAGWRWRGAGTPPLGIYWERVVGDLTLRVRPHWNRPDAEGFYEGAVFSGWRCVAQWETLEYGKVYPRDAEASLLARAAAAKNAG